jgi:hypothetical protein
MPTTYDSIDEARLFALAADRDRYREERDRYRDRLQFDPGGSDKIDELEQSIQFKDHEIECLEREVEHLKLRCKTLSDELRSLVSGEEIDLEGKVGDPHVRDPDTPCSEYVPGIPEGDCETDGHFMCCECRECSKEAAVRVVAPERKSHVCGRCDNAVVKLILVPDGQACECQKERDTLREEGYGAGYLDGAAKQRKAREQAEQQLQEARTIIRRMLDGYYESYYEARKYLGDYTRRSKPKEGSE